MDRLSIGQWTVVSLYFSPRFTLFLLLFDDAPTVIRVPYMESPKSPEYNGTTPMLIGPVISELYSSEVSVFKISVC